jgi:hypothetical protein
VLLDVLAANAAGEATMSAAADIAITVNFISGPPLVD